MKRKIRNSGLLLVVLFFIFTALLFSKSEINAQSVTVPGFSCYRSLNTIYARAAQLETQYPQFVSIIDIGDSWRKTHLGNDQGYDLFALKIKNNTMPEPKPSLILVSGLKANAFAPVEINLRFAEFLLSERETDNTINYLLNNFSIHFIFIANPDGRAIAESLADGNGNPLDITWTKNANPSGCSNGNGGVSLERNFTYQWNHTPT
ncbi:MAG: zinc carboxypeptidase, partial [Chloroflexi bacterium]|nr:zinc carboxypeptidase [Chloroflexota bacterium]